MDRFPFRFCPSCGAEGIEFLGGYQFSCRSCGFVYFHSVAAAVGAFIVHRGSLLCLVRAKEPMRGKLGLPGGFVDPGESAEEALRRECLEEIGLEIGGISLVGGYPNGYDYAGVPYRTCDFYYAASAAPDSALDDSGYPALRIELSEVQEARWTAIADLDMDMVAFPSMRRALGEWKAGRGAH